MDPYQLKLSFQASLNAEGEKNTFVYNKEKTYVTCRVEKVNKGEVFEGLENSEQLLQGESDEEEFDKQVLAEGMEEQRQLNDKYEKAQLTEEYAFGFGSRYRDIFRGQEEVLKEATNLNPLEVPKKDRMKFKLEREDEEFDPERYAYDNYDEESLEQVADLIELKAPQISPEALNSLEELKESMEFLSIQ